MLALPTLFNMKLPQSTSLVKPKAALFYIVWKNCLRRFKVARTPEQRNKR
jgi:hypothetical protein